MSLADEIEKLDRLKQSGSLTEEEYQKAKASLLRQSEPITDKLSHAVNQITTNENSWGMFIHLSQFCGYLLLVAGLVVPVVLWQVKKNESAIIDQHGRIVTNWILSWLIYMVISALLTMIVIGFFCMAVLGILGIVFPIIGAIKANGGEAWEYPLSIRFFSVSPMARNPAAP